jgi:DNA-binding NarL/FixJ family response regulator
MAPVRILIADDHEIVRVGLRALLEGHAGWEVCGEANNGKEAVEKAGKLHPDLVILDVTMPQLNGLESTRRILSASPDVRILVLSMHESEKLVEEVLEIGAHGFLLKSDAGRELISFIEAILKGRRCVSSKLAKIFDQHNPKVASFSPETTLTGREREILQLLAEGRTSKEVALALKISTKTAETHRTNIMQKLNLHSITELTRYAIRNKIVQP